MAESNGNPANLAKRTLTAIIVAPLVIAAVLAGPKVFFPALLVAAALGVNESLRLAGRISSATSRSLSKYSAPAANPDDGRRSALRLLRVPTGTRRPRALPDDSSSEFSLMSGVIRQAPSPLLAFVYVVLPMSCLGLIYSTRSGPIWVIFTLIATWLADTSAYAVGRLFGRRPLAPRISPNKTLEGALGGLAVTAPVLAALTFVPVLSMAERFVFGLALAPAAIAGDLFESWLKRRAGVKNSGNLLPGHGGFLDRIDSLLFTAPLSYLLLRLWI